MGITGGTYGACRLYVYAYVLQSKGVPMGIIGGTYGRQEDCMYMHMFYKQQ